MSKLFKYKLGLTLICLGFLFWQLFFSSNKINYFFENNEKQVLGASTQSNIDAHALDATIATSNDLASLAQAGKIFLDQGNLELAEKTFLRSIEVEPTYRDGYYLLGYTYLKMYQKNGEYNTQSVEGDLSESNLVKARLALLNAKRIDLKSEKIDALLEIIEKI